jgi:hypothetical protein
MKLGDKEQEEMVSIKKNWRLLSKLGNIRCDLSYIFFNTKLLIVQGDMSFMGKTN